MNPQSLPKPVMDVMAPPRPAEPAPPASAPVAPQPAPALPPEAPMSVVQNAQPLAVQPLPQDPLAPGANPRPDDASNKQPEKKEEPAPPPRPKSGAPVGVIVVGVLVTLGLMGLAVLVYVMSNQA